MTHASPTARADDETLLRRGQQGDDAAFAALYARHARLALRTASRILGDDRLAEDVRQEAFVSAWVSRGYRPADGTVQMWLMGVVRRRALDAIRRGRVRPPLTLVSEEPAVRDPGPSPEDVVALRELSVDVRALLGTLPPDQRVVLVLLYFAGLSEPEAADLLGLPATTVRGRARTGLERLRRAVGEPLPAGRGLALVA